MNRAEVGLPDPRVFAEVHMRIGIAVWHIQAFEDTLCYFIALVLKMPAPCAEDEVRAILEKLQSNTLGQLLAELRKPKTSSAVDAFERHVNAFLDERNWLIHKSWRQHRADAFNPETTPPLIARLDAIAAAALELQRLFGSIAHEWTLSQGFSEDELDAAQVQMLKSWRVIKP